MNNFKEIEEQNIVNDIPINHNINENIDIDIISENDIFITGQKRSKGIFMNNDDIQSSEESIETNPTYSYTENSFSKTIFNKNSTEAFRLDEDGVTKMLDIIKIKNNTKTFHTSNDLQEYDLETILEIFYDSDMLIFTDEDRINIEKKNSICKYFCLFGRKSINSQNYPGISFISYNGLIKIKSVISQVNKILSDSDNEFSDFKEKHKNKICFDDGDYFKNLVYKKIQVKNKLLFVPYSKYNLKLTEFKLRSFCEIMEELGAHQIEIEFNHSDSYLSEKKVKVDNNQFNYIAGTLGFSANRSKSNNEEITYKLRYPETNTLCLNEREIKNKIKNKKFLINKKIFDSNLELNYIINSRCRYFIENYSTVFTLDNSLNFDKKMIGRLKSNNFNCGFEFNNKLFKDLKISITTHVKFYKQSNLNNNLLGDKVNLDERGFNYLIGTIKDDEDFKKNGINKIMSFTKSYINIYLKKECNKDYEKIKKLFSNILKEFSFNELKELLLDYFNIDCQWINFLNYIEILKSNSVTFSKIGLLVIMSNDQILKYEKNLKIINFIKHLCTKNNIEDKFWEMLEPNNYYLITNKLDTKYNLLKKFNWFNMEKLINDLNTYQINQVFNSDEEYYQTLYSNFKLGQSEFQFDKYIKPFISNIIVTRFRDRVEKIKNRLDNQILFSNLIYQSIKCRHFKSYDLHTFDKLLELISNKISNIDEASKLYIYLCDSILDSNSNYYFNIFNNNSHVDFEKTISSILNSEEFKLKYPYIYNKISTIINYYIKVENSLENDIIFCKVNCFLNFCSEYHKLKNYKKVIFLIIKKILIFDKYVDYDDYIQHNLTKNGFYNLIKYIKNFDTDKLCYIKYKFSIFIIEFFIKQVNLKLTKKLYQSLLFKVIYDEKRFSFSDIKNNEKYYKIIPIISMINKINTFTVLLEYLKEVTYKYFDIKVNDEIINLFSC